MKQFNYQTGQRGENLAAAYLAQKGYRIIQKNFRTRFGEIDLIASQNQKLIFVEVKLKVGTQLGTPEEMISRHKINQVRQTAIRFLLANPQLAKQYPQQRIDAVCIVIDQGKTIIKHYENIDGN